MRKTFRRDDYVAIHENPVWRDKSDFIIRAYLEEKDGRNEWEQLWAKQIDDRRFSICCIPFFAYDLALADDVETDGDYVVQSVVKPSGQVTFRAWFGNSAKRGAKDEVLRQLGAIGPLLEWSSANLLAISAVDAVQAQQVADCLHSSQNAGNLIYEIGRLELPSEFRRPRGT